MTERPPFANQLDMAWVIELDKRVARITKQLDVVTARLETVEARAPAAMAPPQEPTGLGAVVHGGNGTLWTRVLGRKHWSWRGHLEDWADMDVAEILSHGYDIGGDQ